MQIVAIRIVAIRIHETVFFAKEIILNDLAIGQGTSELIIIQ